MLISFLMLLGTFFLNFFVQNYENVLPAKAGSTFSQHDFYQHRVHDDVSVPKLASKSSLWGGAFPACAVRGIIVFSDCAEMPLLGSSG